MAEKIDIALAGNPNCGGKRPRCSTSSPGRPLNGWLLATSGRASPWRRRRPLSEEGHQRASSRTFRYLLVSLPHCRRKSSLRDFIIPGRPSAIDLVDVTNIERTPPHHAQILSRPRRPVVVGLSKHATRLSSAARRLTPSALQDARCARGGGLGAGLQANLDTLVRAPPSTGRQQGGLWA